MSAKILCKYCGKELGTTSAKEDVLEICGDQECLDKYAEDNPIVDAPSIEETLAALQDKVDTMSDEVDSLKATPIIKE